MESRAFKHLTLTSIISLFFCLLLASLAHASGEVLPEFQSESEKAAMMLRIQRQIPFAGYNNANYFDLQKKGIAALRKKFPNYDQWMREKPSPITIEIFESEIHSELTFLLNAEPLDEIQKKMQARFDREVQQVRREVSGDVVGDASDVAKISKNEEILAQLYTRAMQSLRLTVQNSENSIRGFMVGISHILTPVQRTAFLKMGDPLLQLDFLKGLNISDNELRASKFKAETLKLKQEEITMKQVLAIASDRIRNSDDLVLQLAFLKMLTNMASQELSAEDLMNVKASEYVKNSDFEFLINSEDSFLVNLNKNYHRVHPNEKNRIESTIEKLRASVPKSLFTQKRIEKTEQILLAKVTEVHPYLGIHRGCIGGDCSTTNSPMFPYSPWEHDFYIQTPDGRFVGYISAARIRADGVDSFFLRDLQGATLSPAIAEAILHTFPKVLSHYGAKSLVLAQPSFTDVQNNSPTLKSLLKNYSSQSSNFVPLSFIDAEVRDYIGQTSGTFKSTYNYDSPTVHSRGVLFRPRPELSQKYNYKVSLETLPVPTPRSIADTFLIAARAMLKNPNVLAKEFPEIPARQLTADINVLRNLSGLNLAAYYRAVDSVLTKYNIEFSRLFQEQNEDLFMLGHLKCPDAFYPDYQFLQDKFSRVQDESASKTIESLFFKMSEKYLIQLSRQHQNYEEVMNLVHKWEGTLMKSKKFHELIDLYSERLLPHDVFQLVGFKFAGLDIAKKALESADKLRIEEAVVYLLNSTPLDLGLPLVTSNHMVTKVSHVYLSASSIYANQMETAWVEALGAYGLDVNSIQNPRLKAFVKTSYINSYGFLAAANSSMIEKTISSDISNRSEVGPRAEIVNAIGWIIAGRPGAEIVSQRLKFLIEGGELLDIFEIMVLHQLGSKEATATLARPEIRKKAMAIIEAFVEKEDQKVQECTEFMAAYNRLTRAKNFAFQVVPISTQGSVSSAMASIEKVALNLGIPTQEYLNSKILKKALAPWWLSLKDAFTTPSTSQLEYSFQLLGYYLQQSEGYIGNSIWEELITNFDYLIQKPIMRNFLAKLHQYSKEERCFNCTAGLIHFILAKKIPDSLPLSPQYLKKLASSDSAAVMTYAIAKAYRMKIPIVLTESSVSSILSISSEKGKGSSSFFRPALQKLAIEIFTQSKGVRPEVQKYMLHLVQNDPINEMALKAGLAYLANGGPEATAKKDLHKTYDRAELFTAQGGDAENLWFHRFVNRTSRESLFCQKLFLIH